MGLSPPRRADPAVARVIQPNWMPSPEAWLWRTPAGQLQGFGKGWRFSPGMANLFWLALGCTHPGPIFDVNGQGLVMQVLLHQHGALKELVEAAELMSLEKFYDYLSAHQTLGKVPGRNLGPLFLILAKEAIRDHL